MKHFSSYIVLCASMIFLLPGCTDKQEKEVAVREEVEVVREEGWTPKVVPYLDSQPGPSDGEGTAKVEPDEPVVVGSSADFEVIFTVGPAGITPGGFVLLQISPWWGWSRPQTVDPAGPGYLAVKTSFSDPSIEVLILPLNRVLIFSREVAMPSGGEIAFSYRNARTDKFAEAEELFQVFVDADGDGHSAPIASPPSVRIMAGKPVRLNVFSPSQARPGETVKIQAAPLDGVGNWGEAPSGSYYLAVRRDGEVLDETVLDLPGGERTLNFHYKLPGEGIYFFEVNGPQGLAGESNATLCLEGEPKLNLYFGDIHGHSRISDGTGTPEDFYRYAREVSGLDIAALTDHVDFGTIAVEGEVWEKIVRAADDNYLPGKFVTFVGYEWTNWRYGHRNVYYRDGSGPVFRSIDPESDTPQKLWGLLEPYEAMTVAHHVGGGPVATDWTIPPGEKEWLVEVCSIHGSSEYYGGEAGIYHPVEGAFVRDALEKGYKLGIIGGGDTHDGHPGQKSVGALVTGIIGVYSPELTREAVWEAFRKRQVYGTSGPKIILNFRVADSPMGSEVSWPASQGPVPIACRVVACGEIDRVEVIRNGEEVFSRGGEGVAAQFLLEDPDPPGGTSWYYVRVIQKDGNMAWSSPVWLTVIDR